MADLAPVKPLLVLRPWPLHGISFPAGGAPVTLSGGHWSPAPYKSWKGGPLSAFRPAPVARHRRAPVKPIAVVAAEPLELRRLFAAGALDPPFGNGGGAAVDYNGLNENVGKVLVQPDQKVLISGSTGSV